MAGHVNAGDRSQKLPSVMAAILHSLGDAPRLPPMYWGTPVQQILESASLQAFDTLISAADPISEFTAAAATQGEAARPGDSQAWLSAACILLALKHGSVASHGLGELLDQLMTQQRFAQLPCQLQQMLLIGLPEVLQSLSSQRGAAIAGALSTLCMLGSDSTSSSQGANQLSTAAWVGLARLMHSSQEPESAGGQPTASVTEPVYKAVQQLLRKLPLPPFLLPGEHTPSPSMGLDKGLSMSVDTRSNGKAWGAACTCLQMMPNDKVA